jgi:hypothetical protein
LATSTVLSAWSMVRLLGRLNRLCCADTVTGTVVLAVRVVLL